MKQKASTIKLLLTLNGCSYQDLVIARDIAFEVWEERSMVERTIELGEY